VSRASLGHHIISRCHLPASSATSICHNIALSVSSPLAHSWRRHRQTNSSPSFIRRAARCRTSRSHAHLVDTGLFATTQRLGLADSAQYNMRFAFRVRYVCRGSRCTAIPFHKRSCRTSFFGNTAATRYCFIFSCLRHFLPGVQHAPLRRFGQPGKHYDDAAPFALYTSRLYLSQTQISHSAGLWTNG